MAKRDELRELARKLNEWAENELREYPKQQTLMRWLLSRGAYIEERIDKQRIEGTATYVFRMDIEQAVKDALGPLVRTDLPDPIEGWPREFGSWPRIGDDWPRDGYWALGMGSPPKLPKVPMPPKTPKTT